MQILLKEARMVEREQLNQLDLLSPSRGRCLLIAVIILDLLKGYVADWCYPNDDGAYWELWLKLNSVEAFAFSWFLIVIFPDSVLKKVVISSWYTLCAGDMVDHLFFDRSQTTAFDVVVIIIIALNLIYEGFNLYFRRTNHDSF